MAQLHRHLITVLISSKQKEFAAERREIVQILKRLPLLAPVFAEDWPPELTPVEAVSIRESANCAIYVGLFGCVYSYPTTLEYEAARQNNHRELLIYIRECPDRDPKLSQFLEPIQHPTEGHTVVTFEEWPLVRDRFETHLWAAVARMVRRLLEIAAPPRTLGPSAAAQRLWKRRVGTVLKQMGAPEDPAEALTLAEDIRKCLDMILPGGPSLTNPNCT